MISSFNHLFLTLPNPSQNIIQQINKVMFSFLWNNKTSKIKVSTVQKQYCDGGLKMIIFGCFYTSFKIHMDTKTTNYK